MVRFRLVLSLVLAAGILAACESPQERAERHYRSALALMAEGKVELALVDLRRVFDYDGFHKEARELYARTQMERGRTEEAYGQYLRLIEQYPDTLSARLALSGLAFEAGNWDEFERHGKAAVALAPDDPEVAAIAVALDYRAALTAGDADGEAAAADRARTLLERQPDSIVARRVLITQLLSGDDPMAALPEIDRALERSPEVQELHFARLRLLMQAEDNAGVGAQLERMAALFPDNETVQEGMLRWYLGERDLDRAEAFLRQLAERDPDPTAGYETLVRFLRGTRGDAAALAELDRLVAAAPTPADAEFYRAMAAGLRFESGDREQAIAEMRAIAEGAEPSDQTRDLKVMLARMLLTEGDRAGAEGLVETVLTEDRTNVEALKLRATWAIADDRSEDAIADLRTALGQTPRDAELLTLMASAHAREGSRDLAADRLALAVEASDTSPEEALRYARFLLSENRPQPAQKILTDALVRAPDNLEIIGLLADIALSTDAIGEVPALVRRLEGIDRPEAAELAGSLRTAAMIRQNRVREAVAMLESQIATGDAATQREIALLVLLQAREGDLDAARGTLAAALGNAPDDMMLQMLDAVLDVADQDLAGAEDKLRRIVAERPGVEAPVRELYRLLLQQGRGADAAALIEAELARAPSSRFLRLVHGANLSEAGDIDGAIAVFDALYEEDTGDTVIANNLASLLATYRGEDPAALDRAFAIARRLRGLEVPAFQDTYGWISFLRRDLEEAVRHLEPAAAGLPEDPMVQYHLGRTYLALERIAEGQAQLEKALALAGDSPLPQFELARTLLAELEAPAEANR